MRGLFAVIFLLLSFDLAFAKRHPVEDVYVRLEKQGDVIKDILRNVKDNFEAIERTEHAVGRMEETMREVMKLVLNHDKKLQKIDGTLENQKQVLKNVDEKVSGNSVLLKGHGDILNEGKRSLFKISRTMAAQTDTLQTQSRTLSSQSRTLNKQKETMKDVSQNLKKGEMILKYEYRLVKRQGTILKGQVKTLRVQQRTLYNLSEAIVRQEEGMKIQGKSINMIARATDALPAVLKKNSQKISKDVRAVKQAISEGMRQWKLQAQNVCFEARDNKFGRLFLKNKGSMLAVKLVHKYGSIGHANSGASNWGGGEWMAIFVTDKENRKMFPRNPTSNGWYSVPGLDYRSDELVFTDYSTPAYGKVGQELRLWDGEDLHGYTEWDNRGKVCVDVYIMFESY